MWQLWLCLFGALLLGAVLGWLLRGNCKKKLATLIDDWSQRFGIVEKERNLFALKIQDQDRLKSENKSLLGRLNSMEIGANLASDVLKENKERLDNAEYSLSEMGMQLEQRSTDIFLLKNKLKESVNSSSVIENSASNSVLTDLKKKKIALKKLNEKYQSIKEDTKAIQKRIDSLVQQKYAIIDKIKVVNSVTAIEMLEADLVKTDEESAKLEGLKNGTSNPEEGVDIHKIVAYIKYFMEHLHELLVDLCNPTLKAQYFSVLFDKAPTYEEIKSGTHKNSPLPEVNELFRVINLDASLLVTSRGIEPRLPG